MAKKISAIVSLSLVGILLLITVIMANINVNHNIVYAKPDSIRVQYGDEDRFVRPDNAQYEDILNLVGKSGNENSLKSLLNGTINQSTEAITDSESGIKLNKPKNFYVKFVYNQPQKLMNGNRVYKDSEGKECYYSQLVFVVNSDNAYAKTKVYVTPYYDEHGEIETKSEYTKHYEIRANFFELYNYLIKNDFNK